MDLEHIEKLMSAMEHSKIKKLKFKSEGFEIELEKESEQMGDGYLAPHPVVISAPIPAPAVLETSTRHGTTTSAATGQVASEQKVEGVFVKSPMVGTFYVSPSPQDPPFVKVGDEVQEQSIVCIIEAMKVMNEVRARVKGKIVELLVKNGDPVEFGTKLFRIV